MPAGRGGGRGRQPAGVKSVQRWPRKPQAAAGWPLCAGRTGARTPAGRGRTRARARPRWGRRGQWRGGGREAGTSAGWRRHVAVSPGARRTGEVWPSPDRWLLYRGREGGEGAGTAACARAAVKAGRRGDGVGSTAHKSHASLSKADRVRPLPLRSRVQDWSRGVGRCKGGANI